MATELELKLEVAPEAASLFSQLMRELGWMPQSEMMLANVYYDTPEQSLRQARVALRIRKAGDQWIQTLKTAGEINASGLSRRGEWEWPLSGNQLDLSLLSGHLPQQIDPSTLEPLFSTNFKRTTWLVKHERSLIEVALDQGEIFAAPKRVPISEVELELKSGDSDDLLALADRLRQQIPLQVSTISKAERAQRLMERRG